MRYLVPFKMKIWYVVFTLHLLTGLCQTDNKDIVLNKHHGYDEMVQIMEETNKQCPGELVQLSLITAFLLMLVSVYH